MKAIEGLSVVMRATEFQRRVWAALRDIPAGETISDGVRTVGHANGANLIDIVVPRHRVVGRTTLWAEVTGGFYLGGS